MARTKDPHAATVKAWKTRPRHAAAAAATQSKGDFAERKLSYGSQTADSPEVRAAAERAYALAAQIEPTVTPLVTSVAQKTGGTPVGLDYRLKSVEAIAGKMIRDALEKNIPPTEALGDLTDVNRYTIVYPPEALVERGTDAIKALTDAGWTPYDHKAKNYYPPGDAYDGFNAVYENKLGARFELQFHTPDSVRIKEVAHKIFAKWRVTPATDSPTKDRLWKQMVSLWDNYKRPTGYENLPGRKMGVAA